MKTLTIEIPEPGDDPARMAADAAPAGVHDDSPLETSKADARPWSPSPFYGTPAAPATTRGGWFIDAGQSNIGALWQQVEAGTDGAVWLSSALSADVPALPEPDINTVNHASVRIVGYSSEAARAYGAACRTAAPAGDVQPVAPEQHAAMSRLIELAAECAQRKPLQAFVHLTDATHIGHRQFAAAHSEADDAVRILAIELRKVWDSLRTPAAAPAAQPAPAPVPAFDQRLQHFEWVLHQYRDGNCDRDAVDESRSAVFRATPAAPSVPPLPDDTIAAALADPACTRLREWAAIGPVQRAAVQSFADRLAAAPSVPAGWVDAVMEQAEVFASAWSLVGSPFDDGDALGSANEEKEALRAMLAAAPHPAGGVE